MSNNQKQEQEQADEQPPTAEDVLSGLAQFVKDAGAKNEAATERNGFLSYHAEPHSVGIGFALGMAATSTGEIRYASLLLSLVLYGKAGETNISLPDHVVKDVTSEPHYALAAMCVGMIVGAIVTGDASGVTVFDAVKHAIANSGFL